MAALTDTFNAMTRELYQPGFHDQVYAITPLWAELAKHVRYGSGTDIRAVLQTGKLGGGAYDSNEELTQAKKNIADTAIYPWTYYFVPIILAAQDTDLNEGAGPNRLVNLLDSYINGAGETMRDDHLGTDIFDWHINRSDGPNVPETLSGVVDMCQEVDHVGAAQGEYAVGYGGLAIATYPTWAAHVQRATGASGAWVAVPCTVEIVRELLAEIVHGDGVTAGWGSNKKSQMIVTTPQVHQAWSREIFQRGAPQPIITRRGKDLVNAGFDVYEIDGVPVIADEHCQGGAFNAGEVEDEATITNGHCAFFLNFDRFYLQIARKWNMTFDEWLKPTNIHEYINHMYWWGQVVCEERRAQGALYNIDPLLLYDTP